ncbi:MAG: T9SS type A sorting domain-containing protein [Bacteroidales bacterium]|nr:T9SS type A sorting domain-containing protein [Bacteroidales bacterium]
MRNFLNLLILSVLVCNSANSQDFVLSNYISSTADINQILSQEVIDGNVYVFGDYLGTINVGTDYIANSRDAYIVKYKSDYTIDWFKQLGGGGLDFGSSMVSDGTYIYLVGGFQQDITFDPTVLNSDGFLDIFLAKYDLNGNEIWAKKIAYNEAKQFVSSIDIDKYGDLVVAGVYRDSITFPTDIRYSNSYGMFITKLDDEGNTLFAKDIPTTTLSSKFTDLKAYNENYYFLGVFDGTCSFETGDEVSTGSGYTDVFIYKTDISGNGLWTRRTSTDAEALSGTLSRDNYGNIYFTGYFEGTNIQIDSTLTELSSAITTNGGDDIFIYKYNKNGNLIWGKGYGSTSHDWARGINYQNGFLYCTGYFSNEIIFGEDTLKSSGTDDYDIFLGLIDTDGNDLKAISIDGSDSENDSGLEIDSDSENNGYLAGYFRATEVQVGDSLFTNPIPGNSCLLVAKYDPPFTVAFTKKQNVTCGKGNDGELIVTPFFGVPPINYDWSHDGGLNDSTASSLTAGKYTVTITDNASSIDSVTFNITEPDTFLFNPNITQVTSCSYSTEGAIGLNVSGGNGGNTYYWFESNGGSGVSLLAEDQTGLTTGTYSVTVTDEKGCTADTLINISGPDTIVFTGTTVTHINNVPVAQDGAVNLVVTGGAESYASYTWTGPNLFSASTEDITGLTDGGLYSVTVLDDNGCTADTSLTIIDSTQLFIYFKESDIQNVSCNSLGDGEATITSLGYSGTLSYVWSHDGGLNSPTATGLSAGKYLVTVTDDSGSKTDSVTIIEPLVLNTSTDVPPQLDCNGDNSGYVDLTVTGGTEPYTYNWSTGDKTQDIAGLIADTYNVTVTDANSCETPDNATITDALAILIDIVLDDGVTCYGNNDAQVTANASGGAGGFSYLWDDPGSQATAIADDMPAGSFTVTVTDANSCEQTKPYNITQPGLIVIVPDVYDITCNNENDGAILLNVSGGTPTFDYFWTTSGGSGHAITDKNQSGLSAGRYYFIASDANNCEYEDSVDITNPPVITIDSESATNASASTVADGSVTVSASGGTGDLSYTLNPGSVTNSTGVFNSLLPGDYTVDVTDDNTCGPITSSTLSVDSPDGIVDYFSDEKIRIYPNPVSDRLFVKTEYEGDFTIQLVNASGSVVFIRDLNLIGEKSRMEVNVANYPKGIYFIRLYNKEVSINRKIIIQ